MVSDIPLAPSLFFNSSYILSGRAIFALFVVVAEVIFYVVFINCRLSLLMFRHFYGVYC